MNREEMKADCFRFVADLNAKLGLHIDPEKVWKEAQRKIVRYGDGEAGPANAPR